MHAAYRHRGLIARSAAAREADWVYGEAPGWWLCSGMVIGGSPESPPPAILLTYAGRAHHPQASGGELAMPLLI